MTKEQKTRACERAIIAAATLQTSACPSDLEDRWLDYVLELHAEAVLLGVRSGLRDVLLSLHGPPVTLRRLWQEEVKAADAQLRAATAANPTRDPGPSRRQTVAAHCLAILHRTAD